jgi:hypothetical protein
MLVRFSSEVGGFIMFGDAALKLLCMTGHSASVPGAIAAEQMVQALERLEAQVNALTLLVTDAPRGAAGEVSYNNDGKDTARSVSLAQRAFPLVELMRRAVTRECAIQWREG